MITADEAVRLIVSATGRLGTERLPLDKVVTRILAEDLLASADLPPFDNSAMDGYAVRAADLAGASAASPATLEAKDTVRAGDFPATSLKAGEAFRILTGAPVPAGADAVVMQEYTAPAGTGKVAFLRAPRPGDHIRRAGEDVRRGSPLAAVGTHIRPYEVALFASQGLAEIGVFRRPRVAVLATGDELVPVSAPLTPGKIRNSNGPALAAGIRRWDIEADDLGIVPDDPEAIESALSSALAGHDSLLLSGGVSVGDFDYCKDALIRSGVEEIFWGVAIKPGKPLWFGVWRKSPDGIPRPVFGLPGNPVSVLVCLEEFVRPALERLEGRAAGHSGFNHEGTAENDYPKDDERQRYLFCNAERLGDGYRVTVIRPQGSAMVGMACRANALAVRPAGGGPVKRGEPVRFRWLK